jgi:hypothetical protein
MHGVNLTLMVVYNDNKVKLGKRNHVVY